MDTQPTATNYTDGSEATHEEQDEDQKWDWYVGGMIIHDSKIHLVTVHQAFLVMDTPAWAAAHATAHAEAAATATTEEARRLNERVARGLRRWLEGDPNYLEDGFPLWALVPAIAFRAKIGVLKVNEANFDQYMTRLLARTISARRSVPPAFILLADTERPCIFVTRDASYMVDFASAGVVTEIVSQEQLWYNFQQFARAYEMASPDLNGADQAAKNKPHVKGENQAMTALYKAWGAQRGITGGDFVVQEFLYSILSGTHGSPTPDDEDLDKPVGVPSQDAPSRKRRASRRHTSSPGLGGKKNG